MKNSRSFIPLILLAACLAGNSACSQNKSQTESDSMETTMQEAKMKDRDGGPKLGEKPKGGFIIDKTGDSTLQAMITEVLPRFRQFTFKDEDSGQEMAYNLFTPSNTKKGEKYPLVLFIADASTPGDDVTRPLTQGYGGLIWATDEWQKAHPCYVLVPQFSGVAVNDAHDHTQEVPAVLRLVKNVAANEAVDTNRLYTTGQSMGGMISMFYNVAFPDVFAASIFVDSHWNLATFPELVKHTFVWFIAGNEGKAYPQIGPLEAAAKKDGVKYVFSEWSAKLPEAEQDKLADKMFAEDAPVNLIMFTPKSVLPADGKGSEHMLSFDYAYKVKAVREWLFRQHK